MRVAKEQNRAFVLKTPVCVMYDAFTRGQANLVKIFPAVNARGMTIALYLERIKPF